MNHGFIFSRAYLYFKLFVYLIDIPVSKIMKEPAITAMQRFQVLDARDAALRASKYYCTFNEIKKFFHLFNFTNFF